MSVEVTPEEIMYFRQPLVDRPTLTMKIKNLTNRHVVFRIKTTAPKMYTTKPHQGVILPRESMSVLVTVVGWKEEPHLPSLPRPKDKFLIQTVDVPQGQEEGTVQDIMAWALETENKGQNVIKQRKLRVSYLPPAAVDGRAAVHDDGHEETLHEHDHEQEHGIGGSAVLIHHSTVLPQVEDPLQVQQGSSSSSSDSHARGRIAFEPPNAGVLESPPQHAGEPSLWHESLSGSIDLGRGGTAVDAVSILKQRRASEYHIDDAASLVELEKELGGESEGLKRETGAGAGVEGQVGSEHGSVTVPDRFPPFLKQDVPLWTVLAGIAATYTVTRLFGL